MSWDEPKNLEEAAQLAKALAGASLLPEVMRSPENLLLVMGYAKSMRISPFAALRLVSVIGGRPTLSADGLQAVVRASGVCARLDVVETTDERCEVLVQRTGGQPVTIVWDMARAKTAGLGQDSGEPGKWGKPDGQSKSKQWTKYPRQMLRARALSEACRLGFPDVVGGVYDPNELGAIDVTEVDNKALPSPAQEPKALPSEAPPPEPTKRAQKALPVEQPKSESKITSAQATEACLAAERELVEHCSVAREVVHDLLVAAIKSLQPKGIPSAEVIAQAAFAVALSWSGETLAVVFDGDVSSATEALRKAVGGKLTVQAVADAARAIMSEDGDVEA